MKRYLTRPYVVTALVLFAAYTAIALLFFGKFSFDDLARDVHGRLTQRFIEETTGAYSALLLLPFVVFVTRRFPIGRSNWYLTVPIALGSAVVYSAAHTTLMLISRDIIFPLAGMGPYDYGNMLFRYPMEGSGDLVNYAFITGCIYAWDRTAAARHAQLAAAELQTKLATAQLENLRLQLNPHFLFNTLNAISSVMYEDVRKADAMIAKLSDFLRLVLASKGVHQVPLDEELDVERKYVEIMKTRLEQRLDLRVHVEDPARDAVVPFMILQPLLENSIQHGVAPERGALEIEIAVRRKNGSTVISVADDGVGYAPSSARENGHGLSIVRSRLAYMYGDAGGLTIAALGGGGTQATVTFPFAAAGTQT